MECDHYYGSKSGYIYIYIYYCYPWNVNLGENG